MLASTILTAVALAVGVAAQTSATRSSTSTAASASASPSDVVIHEIAVGSDPHKFTPEVLENVKPGEIIRFNFYPGGHRVARAEYMRPCVPYEYNGGNRKGFYSGVFDPKTISTPLPHYDVRVNDTDPIFFYCGAPGSCYHYGMVGVINPTENMTFEAQQEEALKQTYQLVPGDPWPSETAPPPDGPARTGTPSPDGINDNDDNKDNNAGGGGSGGLSGGAIAGIAIGGAAVLILGAALIYLCGRRGGFDKAYRKSVFGHVSGADASPSMVEAKYGIDPKSPGQATLSTFVGDPYRPAAHSPHAAHFNGHTPPPVSPGYPTYNSSHMPGAGYPLMGDTQNQYAYQHSNHGSPPPGHTSQFQAPAPVELPSSENPPSVHSPPPQYPDSANRDSWTTGNYGPGKP